jgi:hypothetical protein
VRGFGSLRRRAARLALVAAGVSSPRAARAQDAPPPTAEARRDAARAFDEGQKAFAARDCAFTAAAAIWLVDWHAHGSGPRAALGVTPGGIALGGAFR